MSQATRFLFLKLDVEITVDFREGAQPLFLNKEIVQLILEKSDIKPEFKERVGRLILWMYDEDKAGKHTRISESHVPSLYMPNSTRHTYHCPKYLMIRYRGIPFPPFNITAERNVTQELNNETQSILNAKFKSLQAKEIDHDTAEELLKENSGYLLPFTYHEEEKKKK